MATVRLHKAALAAVKATAKGRRPLGDGKRLESAERASWRARVDVELRENGTALINVRRSKTDPTAEGVTL